MTLIKDLIAIPEVVHRGDFVLKLTEGVTRPEETVRNYVVTPELVRNFDDALAFIKGALEANTSKACYLHGSFGSGKSHFMAILDLILEQDPNARSIVELASVIEKANAWTAGRKFLLVPYHMIGARNMEAGHSWAATPNSFAASTRRPRFPASSWPRGCLPMPRTFAARWAKRPSLAS